MSNQNTINRDQRVKNDKQTIINDKTKFDLSFNNVYAIVVALIVIAASWFNLSSRLDMLTQKVDQLLENQKIIISKYEGVQIRLGLVELQHEKIKTILKINE